MTTPGKHLFGLPADDLAHVLRHAESDLAEWRRARVFITGGTGFFGKWLLGALLHADAELQLGLHLTVLSRDPAAFLKNYPALDSCGCIDFQRGDVATFSPLKERYDYILHAATDSVGVAGEQQEAARDRAILEGTRRVLDLARNSGARKSLLVSSGGVYGAATGKLSGAREDDPVEPVTPYGRAKRAAEKLGEESGQDVVIARAFAFLGPLLPLDAHFAAGNFIRDASRGESIRVRGDGTARRSYLYPADLVIWLLRVLGRGSRGRSYNVGSDEVVTTAQLAQVISEASASHPEVLIENLQPNGPASTYLPDISRAREELGLDVFIPLRDAVMRTLRYLEE